MENDHRCLRHDSLGNASNRETFFAEILIPKMGKHFTNLRPFKFNSSSLAADINYAEMIVVILSPQSANQKNGISAVVWR
jgi:hypothetical protein